MDLKTLASLRPALGRYVRRYDDCIKMEATRSHLATYVEGQLGSLPRKSVEPIALEAGVSVRTLQEFLSVHRWDDRAMRDRVQEIVAKEHAHPQAISVIDETSHPKKGDKTPGVQRQHCGATGKTDNCVITVHLGYVANDFHALLDGDLYLPQSWHKDRRRCRSAGIPDSVQYRPKWRIALDLLEGAVSRGVRTRWLCADEEYGRPREFRQEVADLGIRFVLEIPCSHTGWLASRPPDEQPRRVDEMWERGGPSWETWRVKETGKGWSVWRVRAVRFALVEEDVAGDEGWLIIATNVLEPEKTKYFFSNAPADESIGTLLFVAFSRWHIERLFQEGKSEVGFDHFEGRTYTGFLRHIVLTAVSLLFLAKQRQRLKKGAPESGPSSSFASPSRLSSTETSLAASAAGG